MHRPEAILHQRDPNLHKSREVEDVAAYLRANGERVPNEPTDKIATHIGFLANKEYINDGILTGDPESMCRQIEACIIDSENVPESYFDLQRRIARDQGRGDIDITTEMRGQMIEAIQSDQRGSIARWAEYLNTDDAGYPDWFNAYTWNSVIKLADFDKEKGEFRRRSKSTTANYPDLNREALSYVYDALNSHYVYGEIPETETMAKLLKSANFDKLYTHAVREVTPASAELRGTSEGSWMKYNQTSDPEKAKKLARSLQGHGTGWCTAGEATAEEQLKDGDFYVYYSKDEQGNDTIPRIAIRMEGDDEYMEVAEVRGINSDQEMEPVMIDLVSEKLKELPGGEVYLVKAKNMKQMTEIERKVQSGQELRSQDLRILYEIDGETEGFGYEDDPRLEEIKEHRDFVQDLLAIFGVSNTSELAQRITEEIPLTPSPYRPWRGDWMAKNCSKLVASKDPILERMTYETLKELEYASAVLGILDKLSIEVDHEELVETLFKQDAGTMLLRDLDKFPSGTVDAEKFLTDDLLGGSRVYIYADLYDVVANNIDVFKDRQKLFNRLMTSDSGGVLSVALTNLNKFEDVIDWQNLPIDKIAAYPLLFFRASNYSIINKHLTQEELTEYFKDDQSMLELIYHFYMKNK
jgi:hypothetical protein